MSSKKSQYDVIADEAAQNDKQSTARTDAVRSIIERLKAYTNTHSMTDLAAYLGVKQTSISNWIRRGSIPWEKVLSKCEGIDVDWLRTGRLNSEKKEIPSLESVDLTLHHESPPDPQLQRSAKILELFWRQASKEEAIATLMILGFKKSVAENLYYTYSPERLASFMTDQFWIRMGYSVERRLDNS